MDGLMMDRPLLVKQIAERAEAVFGDREVVGRTQEGSSARPTDGSSSARGGWPARWPSSGVGPGDRVASFGWNSLRHLELYLAVPSMGAVLHTLNIRLFEDDLRYIVEHAEDRVIFLDASLADAMPRFEGVEREVLMPDGPRRARGRAGLRGAGGRRRPGLRVPRPRREHGRGHVLHERHDGPAEGRAVLAPLDRPAHPRRSQPDSMGIREADSVMPVVPMFHAMAWGMPYIAAMLGARQVLPGPDADPAAAGRADRRRGRHLERRRADDLAGHPGAGSAARPLRLRELKAGGSAVPEPLIRAFDERFGVPLVQGWGMTETSPLAAASPPAGGGRALRRRGLRAASHARAASCRWSSSASTRSRAASCRSAARGSRAPTTEDPSGDEKFTDDGWLRTGDVAELERRRYIRLVDRTKDLVKSGGEWISSVELENEIMAHPDVIEAAVIAVPDERWGERPCACVVRATGARPRRRRRRELPRRAGRQVVDPGARRVHRRGAQDVGRQVRQEGPARPVRGQRGGSDHATPDGAP